MIARYLKMNKNDTTTKNIVHLADSSRIVLEKKIVVINKLSSKLKIWSDGMPNAPYSNC